MTFAGEYIIFDFKIDSLKHRVPSVLLAVLTGVLLSLAWPARGFPLLLFVALVPLLMIEERLAGKKRAGTLYFGYSYMAFLIWNACTTWWIYNSSPEGAFVAILANSVFMATVMRLFQQTKKVFGAARGYTGLVLYWLLFEYLHLGWDLSWPWLMLGNGFANWVPVIQWYEWTGVMGGTLWVWLINILVYTRLVKPVIQKEKIVFTRLWIPLLLLIVPAGISLVRYFTYTETENPVEIVLVQPNVDPWRKYSDITPLEQTEILTVLAEQQVTPETEYVICPESAIPVGVMDNMRDSSLLLDVIHEFIVRHPRVKFITGITEYHIFEPGENIPVSADRMRDGRYIEDYNTSIQIDRERNYQSYYKAKLVPGPESMPFGKYLKPFQQQLFGNLGNWIGDMGRSKERMAFENIDGPAKAAPVICYESIYGEFTTGYIKKGANFIAISTNDAWWGKTPGHRQLLAYSRLRAIETRRSIARSANVGIACFINQKGDVISPSVYNEQAVIRGTINLNDKMTLYTRTGDMAGKISLVVAPLLLLYTFVKGFLNKKEKKRAGNVS